MYDLSLHGPNGFFRHFAGLGATTLRVEVHADHDSGQLRSGSSTAPHPHGSHSPVVVNVADAYGPDRHVS